METATLNATAVDGVLGIIREILELQKEGTPDLDVEDMLRYATENPDKEVVDSIGAVSVLCVLYGAQTPESFIPAHLLTHKNLSTLEGLKKVVTELGHRKQQK